MQKLATAREVINRLGGYKAVAALIGRVPASTSYWQAKNKIPPEYYVLLKTRLKRVGCTAPDHLWGMIEK
jgi:hypothetical protein